MLRTLFAENADPQALQPKEVLKPAVITNNKLRHWSAATSALDHWTFLVGYWIFKKPITLDLKVKRMYTNN